MSIEYLGNKGLLLERLWKAMSEHLTEAPGGFADLFSGTATVSAFMRQRGYTVTANDSLLVCATFAEAALLTDRHPTFDGLAREGIVSRPLLYRYQEVIDILNGLAPVRGFMFRTYSPASQGEHSEARMYFTEANAGLLDAVRQKIREWDPVLTSAERALLRVDLVRAANQVSNIAGTYGCYLKTWKARALSSLILKPSTLLLAGPTGSVFRGDANELAPHVTAEVVYADPPYTKRQYAAYYHVLETLVTGDEPDVSGSTGLRPWEHAASDYCYRHKAPAALEHLLTGLDGAAHFFLSYNEDGQIPHEKILKILGDRGQVSVHEFSMKRYKSSNRKHKGDHVLERLYHVKLAA